MHDEAQASDVEVVMVAVVQVSSPAPTGPGKRWSVLSSLGVVATLLIGLVFAAPSAQASTPVAPVVVAPANGASVLVPFTISWSAVSDPIGINAYNWQVSPTSTFATIVQQGSTTSPKTDATVSGLANGTYFWRVQAVNNVAQGTFSAARSVLVTGAGPTSPGTPTLNPPLGGTTKFHPFESIVFTWTAVPGAATYVFEVANALTPLFPVLTTRVHQDNIVGTTTQTVIADFCNGCEQGNYLARVYAVSAAGIRGVPSPTVAFSAFYNNPLPAPPMPTSPVGGVTVTDPVTLNFSPSSNPQELGYEVEVSRNAAFTSIEDDFPFFTAPTHDEVNLTSGVKFWRVRSFQGDNSPTTAAATAWSPAATFTVSSAPPVPASLSLTRTSPFSGDDENLGIQLTGVAPAAGTVVKLTSSVPSAVTVPASVTVPNGAAQNPGATPLVIGQVSAPTDVTVTASVGTSSTSVHLTVQPPSLKELYLGIQPVSLTGGVPMGGILYLNGSAPPGAVVHITSSVPAAIPAASVTVPAGNPTTTFTIPTNDVAASTPVTVTATWNGSSVHADLTVTPSPKPVSLTITPNVTSGFGSVVQGSVTVASAPSADATLQVSSDNPAYMIFLTTNMTIPAGSTVGTFQIPTTAVTVQTVVHISVTGGGTTVSDTLTVNAGNTPPPPPPPTLSAFTVTPGSVTGGTPATGKVTLPSAAPAGGTVVNLSTNLPLAATVPASVTVPAGATSATFTVTTFPVDTTTVEVFASNGATSLDAPLGITIAPGVPGTGQVVTVTATGRSGTSIVSSPAGLSVPVGTSAGAQFTGAVTLSATGGRDVIWSGACSSSGKKAKSCTFTPTGPSAVTASVQ
jgi:hypothetical protein